MNYDVNSSVLIVTAVARPNINQTYYGDYDAMVWLFNKNMTLLSATSYGGNGSDSGSVVVLPYVLLSIQNYASSDFGNQVSGPAILSLGLDVTTLTTPAIP